MVTRGGRAYRQSAEYKEAIKKRDDYKCQRCGCGVGEACNWHWAPVTQLDVAHIVPWPEGASTPDNQRTLCHPCNKREGYGTQDEPVVVGATYYH